MKTVPQLLATIALLLVCSLSLEGCGCGFDCNSTGNQGPAILSLGFVDESLEQLKQVVVEVDTITLRRTGAADVVIDTFTIDELGLVGAETFQLDLLQYRGRNQLPVIKALELDAQTYTDLLITVLDNDINRSYVQESDDTLKQLNVGSRILTLPGPNLNSGTQQFTVVFSLAQALQFQAASGNYRLTTAGVRVVNNAGAASLSGRVDATLFNSITPCDAKPNPQSGNRIYLYTGSTLPAGQLSDVFTAASGTPIPAGATAPFAVASLAKDLLTGSWQYVFGFVPAGEYTLAFSCAAAGDDPVNYDGLPVPLPSEQLYRIGLAADEQATCDLKIYATCS